MKALCAFGALALALSVGVAEADDFWNTSDRKTESPSCGYSTSVDVTATGVVSATLNALDAFDSVVCRIVPTNAPDEFSSFAVGFLLFLR